MGRTTTTTTATRRRAGSLPSPSSSSSSDFEFTVSLSPTSRRSSAHLCPADELFYKGQLLPLHLSPRISMVRTLLLSSSSSSSSSTDTAPRDSNGSSSSSSSSSSLPPDLLLLLPPSDTTDSSRPSSATDDDTHRPTTTTTTRRGGKYFTSLANRLSLSFLNRGGGSKKDPSAGIDLCFDPPPPPPTPSKAKQVIKKYVKKVRPLYERLSTSSSQKSQINQNQNQNQSAAQSQKKKTFSFSIRRQQRDAPLGVVAETMMKKMDEEYCDVGGRGVYRHQHSHSFSGNLKFPRRRRCAGSCPSSMRSSPAHSGLLHIGGAGGTGFPPGMSSSMEELQSAIQGAIAHCKSSMTQSGNINQRKASLM